MDEIETTEQLRRAVSERKCASQVVGFVPTMGYLHEGHVRLAEAAREENDLVVMSVFVNPAQFGPKEDFERYPRDLDRDRRTANSAGVDILFLPPLEEVYPDGLDGQQVWVDPGPLGADLEGEWRPGHFRGVATVVTKLLNMVQPDKAYFGQKDAQQALVVQRLVRDLSQDVEISLVPTVRESDGLALSSRNVYLSRTQRAEATALPRALFSAEEAVESGERDAWRIARLIRSVIRRDAPGGSIDYVAVRDLATFRPVESLADGDVLLAVAVRFGATRLIDNVIVRSDNGNPSFL